MTLEVASIGVVVKSEGVDNTTKQLNTLASSAENAERKVASLTSSMSSLTNNQKNALLGVGEGAASATSRIESFLKKLQAQVDLFGANSEKMATYKATSMSATEAQIAQAASLGNMVDKLKDASAAFKEMNAEEKKLASAQTAAIIEDKVRAWKSLGAAQAEAIAMNNALDAQKSKEAAFLSSLKLQADSYGKNNEQLAILRATQAGYSAETIKMAGIHGAALDKIQQGEKAIKSHAASMRDAHDMARGLSGGLGALWLTYGNVAPMVAGVAIAASMKAIVSIGKDVENTLEGIRVKGGETVESVGKLRDVVMTLGQGVYGPQEVTKALETLILAGLNAKEAALGINAALNLATVGGTSIEKASYALVQVGTALGYSAAGYDRIADVIAATAAASMSSVESISESFKSGSVVGKLYGATLSDIGVEFALLSNLGIKGSAAGTAVKNFYSVILGDSKKTVDALKSIGLSMKDFKDSEGNVKPLIEVFGTLDKALAKYNKTSQDVFVSHASNERGMKLLVEGLDAIRTKGEQSASKMEDIFKRIDESYGFAAQGAAAMALTVDAQFKSVKNTLETQFLKAFQDVQPQIAVVARALKDAFKSEEFTKGIQSIATAIADLTVFLIENASSVKLVLEAFLAWKAITFVGGLLVSIAQGILAVEKALAAGRIAALAFQASLGLLGAALLAAGAAYAWWLSKKDESSQSSSSRATLTYLDDFNKKLDEENERLTKQIQLLAEGKTKREAETQAMIDQQRHMIELKRLEAGQAERTNYNNLKGGLSATGQALLAKAGDNEIKIGGFEIPTQEYKREVEAVNAVIRAKHSLNSVEAEANKIAEDATKALEKNIVLSKASSALADKNSKESRAGNSGEEDIKQALTKAQIAAAWRTQLNRIQGEIEAINDKAKSDVRDLESEYKRGTIGEISLIERRKNVELQATEDVIAKLKEKLALATPENKEPVREEIINAEMKQIRQKVELEKEATRQIAEYYSKMEDEILQDAIKGLKAKGKFAEAFEAEQTALYRLKRSHLEDNLANEFDPIKRQQLIKDLQVISNTFASGKTAATLKEMDYAAQAMVANIRDGITAIAANSEHNNILDKIFNPIAIDALLKEKLPELRKQLDQEAEYMKSAGMLVSDEWKKALASRETEYNRLLKHMSSGVNLDALKESVAAFSKPLADLVGQFQKLINVQTTYSDQMKRLAEEEKKGKDVTAERAELDKANLQAQLQGFGALAGAAKGFFKQQSDGYKAMEALEKGLYAAQMTLNMASAIGAVLGQGQGDPYSAWVRMAAMAAAVAAIGFSVNWGGGGEKDWSKTVAEQQASQGTGTVLGDATAKSESISKAMDILKDVDTMTMHYSASMAASLKNIENNIAAFASLLFRSAGIATAGVPNLNNYSVPIGENAPGINYNTMVSLESKVKEFANKFDPINKALGGLVINSLMGGGVTALGQFFGTKVTQNTVNSGLNLGSGELKDYIAKNVDLSEFAVIETKKKKAHGLLGSSSETNNVYDELGSEFYDQVSKLFSSLSKTMSASAGALGMDIANTMAKVSSTTVSLGEISLHGMKAEDAQAALSAVLSSAFDKLAAENFPQLTDFQKVGEGYYETVVRVASGVEQASVSLKQLGVTAISYTDILDKQGDVAAEIVKDSIKATEGLSGIGKIIENVSGSAEEIANTYLQLRNLRDIMNGLGMASSDVTSAMIRGAGGLDALKSGLQDYQDNFFTKEQQMASKRSVLQAQFNRLGVEMPTTIEGFKAAYNALKGTSEKGDELAGGMLSLSKAFSEVFGTAEDASNAVKQSAQTQSDLVSKYKTDVANVADAQKQLVEGFAKYGKEVPKNNEGFLALLTGPDADTATEKGREFIETLKNLAPAFDTVQNSAQAAAKAITDAQDKAKSTQGELIDKYSSESEKVNKATKDLVSGFAKVGEVVPKTSEELLQLVKNADPFSAKGQLLINTVNGLSSAFDTVQESIKTAKDTAISTQNSLIDKYTSDSDKLANAKKKLAEGFDEQGMQVPTTVEEFLKIITDAKSSTLSGQTLLKALNDLAPAFDIVQASVKSLTDAAKQAEQDAISNKSSLFDKYASDNEKVFKATTKLAFGFAALGESVPTTAEEFLNLSNKQFDTASATQDFLKALVDLAPAFDTVQSYIKTTAEAAKQLSNQKDQLQLRLLQTQSNLFQSLGDTTQAEKATKKYKALQRQIELAGTDESLRPLLIQIYDLEDQADGAAKSLEKVNKATEEYKSIQSELEGLLGNTAAARKRELDALEPANRALKQYVYTLQDAANAMDGSLSSVQRAVDAEKTRVQEASDAQVQELQNKIDANKTAMDNAKNSVDTLKGIFDTITNGVKTLRGGVDTQTNMLQARSYIDMALALAKSGVMPDAQKLSDAINVVTQDKTNGYSTAFEFNRAQMVQAGKLEQLGSLVDKNRTIAQQQLDALDASNKLAEDQIKAIQDNTKRELTSLDKQLKAAQDQVSVMKGVDISVKSVAQAISDLSNSIKELAKARSEASTATGVTSTLPTTSTGLGGLSLPPASGATGKIPEATLGIASGTVNGIGYLVMPETVYKAAKELGLSSKDVADQYHALGINISQEEIVKKVTGLGLPAFAEGGFHAGGWRLVGEDGPELEYTPPSRIYNSRDTSQILNSDADTAEEIRMLKEENRAQAKAIVSLQSRLIKVVERWDTNGMPETRSVT